MDFNRNQFFFLGMVILLLGLQLRMVQAYVLTPESTRIINEQTGSSGSVGSALPLAAGAVSPTAQRVIEPPEWLGWCLMSIGSVLILHSLAMPKPGG